MGGIPTLAGWHPRIRQLHDHWRSVHPPGGLPGRQHVDPAAMSALLPNLWLLDVQREPFRLRYRLVGTMVTRCVGREVTGQWMDEAQPRSTAIEGFYDRYRGVVEEKTASWRKGAALLEADPLFHRLENIVLPLARDGSAVDMLLAMTVYYRSDGAEY